MEEKQNTESVEMKTTKNPADLKLNYPQTIKIGLGFAVVMIFWTVYNFVVPLLLDQAFGFTNTIRNIIVGIASAMCMVLLPVFGKISDKSGKTKWGKKFGRRTPFIIAGTAITIIAMILVPISVQQQLKDSTVVREKYEAFFTAESGDIAIENPEGSGTITRKQLLGQWYDEAAKGDYSHISKADFNRLKESHPENTREFFTGLYNINIETGQFFGVFGKAEYIQDKGLPTEKPLTEAEYNDLHSNIAQPYSAFVSGAANDFVSSAVNKEVNWGYFVFFLISLLLIIFAQTVIRTPAVSLMPDVTPSPLRSPGNAMINLIGGVGGGIGFLIYTITFMFDGKISLSTQYWIIFGVMAAALALVIANMTSPDLLILDEHTAALDPKSSETVMGLTDKFVRKRNMTSLMVTHNLRFAVEYGTRLIMMHEGKCIVDIKGEEKEKASVDDLLRIFNQISIEVGN